MNYATPISKPGVVNQATARHKAPLALRTVALFELAKGILVLCVGLGLLSLVHKDVQAVAMKILHDLHFDPAWHFSHALIENSARLTDARIHLLALGGLAYSAVRFVETYGLWHERHWAEWFAVISAGLYLPLEIRHVYRGVTWTNATVFLVNLVILLYLIHLLLVNHRQKVAARRARATL